MTRRNKRGSDPWGYFPKDRGKIQQCFECGFETSGRHHVVPVVMGGTKVIPLCSDCHTKAHGDQDAPVIRVDLIREGIEKKRQAGWQPGRPRKMTAAIWRRIHELRDQKMGMKTIAKLLGLSVGTVHKACHSKPHL